MPTTRLLLVRAAPALALLLAACDRETADLVQEINDARAGCTQEMLKAGDEACVQMMEKYAEMGTEVMHTAVGAVKSLDQALQRMPPASFDTAGLGVPIRIPLEEAAAQGLVPGAPSMTRSPLGGARLPAEHEWEGADPSDPGERPDLSGWEGAARGRAAGGYADDPRARPADGGWGDAEGAPPHPDRSGWGGAPPGARPSARAPQPAPERPAAAPPRSAPGVLLPPERRLDRPWLRDDPEGERDRAPAEDDQ